MALEANYLTKEYLDEYWSRRHIKKSDEVSGVSQYPDPLDKEYFDNYYLQNKERMDRQEAEYEGLPISEKKEPIESYKLNYKNTKKNTVITKYKSNQLKEKAKNFKATPRLDRLWIEERRIDERIKQKEYRIAQNAKQREWYKKRIKRNPEYWKMYYVKNKENLKKYTNKIKNDPTLLEKHRLGNRKAQRKRRESPKYILSQRISSGVYYSLKTKGGSKCGGHWEGLVGYTIDELMNHLKLTLPAGYVWADFLKSGGELAIDHIRPISSFNFISSDDAEFKKCWSLSNLQILTKKENLLKGSKLL